MSETFRYTTSKLDHPTMQRTVDCIDSELQRVFTGRATTSFETFDDQESYNLSRARTGDQGIDIMKYLRSQRDDRQAYRISPDLKNVTLMTRQAFVPRRTGQVLHPFGFSVEPWAEGVALVDAIQQNARHYRETTPKLSRIIAFTALHETGHLAGLFPESHCRNVCAMATTSSTIETLELISQMPKSVPRFCVSCMTSLRRK